MSLKRFGLISTAVAGCAAIATAQFSIDVYTIDGGGGKSTGGNFEVEGTIGQHDASNVMTGGPYEVYGGFWGALGFCPTDITGDGFTDLDDLQLLLFFFGQAGELGDVNGDGATDLADLQLLLFEFGQPC